LRETISQIAKAKKWTGSVAQMVEGLLCKHEALCFFFLKTKKVPPKHKLKKSKKISHRLG
jgi:hypothetical protein